MSFSLPINELQASCYHNRRPAASFGLTKRHCGVLGCFAPPSAVTLIAMVRSTGAFRWRQTAYACLEIGIALNGENEN